MMQWFSPEAFSPGLVLAFGSETVSGAVLAPLGRLAKKVLGGSAVDNLGLDGLVC